VSAGARFPALFSRDALPPCGIVETWFGQALAIWSAASTSEMVTKHRRGESTLFIARLLDARPSLRRFEVALFVVKSHTTPRFVRFSFSRKAAKPQRIGSSWRLGGFA
jgi:hypothetical protein